MLAKAEADLPSIMTGLLHDTVEDTGATLELVTERFGPEVSALVDGAEQPQPQPSLPHTLAQHQHHPPPP